jgi:hypothetical protein
MCHPGVSTSVVLSRRLLAIADLRTHVPDNVPRLLRDAALAIVALAGLGEMVCQKGESHVIRSPWTVFTGAIGAIILESVLLRYPEITRTVWERPSTQLGGLTTVLVTGYTLTRHNRLWGVGVCWWGLITYLGMVLCVLSGHGNPVSQLIGNRTG